MNHPVGECEECGETEILAITVYGNICSQCEQVMEEIDEDCED